MSTMERYDEWISLINDLNLLSFPEVSVSNSSFLSHYVCSGTYA